MPLTLLLEDDVELAFELVDLLETRGHEVVWAKGAFEALGVLHELSVDLVVSDIYIYHEGRIVTDGGVSLIGAMRSPVQTSERSLLSIPIIAMSGGGKYKGQKTVLSLARSLGAHRVIAKPFSDDALLELVDELLSPEFDARRL